MSCLTQTLPFCDWYSNGNHNLDAAASLQGLTMLVAHSSFASGAGPAIAWSPAVPGRLQGCAANGNRALAEAFYPACAFQEVTGVAKAMPALANVSATLEDWLPDGVHVVDTKNVANDSAVDTIAILAPSMTWQSVQLAGSSKGTATALLNLPPEVLAARITAEEVCSALAAFNLSLSRERRSYARKQCFAFLHCSLPSDWHVTCMEF